MVIFMRKDRYNDIIIIWYENTNAVLVFRLCDEYIYIYNISFIITCDICIYICVVD